MRASKGFRISGFRGFAVRVGTTLTVKGARDPVLGRAPQLSCIHAVDVYSVLVHRSCDGPNEVCLRSAVTCHAP